MAISSANCSELQRITNLLIAIYSDTRYLQSVLERIRTLYEEECRETLMDTLQSILEPSKWNILTKWMIMERNHISLLIFIGGPPYCGKSFVSTQLASRLNIPCVIHTSSILSQLSMFPGQSSEIGTFEQECDIVQKYLRASVKKCFVERKSLIVEGVHLVPSSFEALISSIPEHVKQGVIVLYVQFQLCKNQHGLAQLSKLSQKSHQAQEKLHRMCVYSNTAVSEAGDVYNVTVDPAHVECALIDTHAAVLQQIDKYVELI